MKTSIKIICIVLGLSVSIFIGTCLVWGIEDEFYEPRGGSPYDKTLYESKENILFNENIEETLMNAENLNIGINRKKLKGLAIGMEKEKYYKPYYYEFYFEAERIHEYKGMLIFYSSEKLTRIELKFYYYKYYNLNKKENLTMDNLNQRISDFLSTQQDKNKVDKYRTLIIQPDEISF